MQRSNFLQSIAALFASHYGNRVSELAFVFPTRRAGMFFRKYLTAEFSTPVLSPEIMTLNEVFADLSAAMPHPLRRADNISLLFRLYEVYQENNPQAESFEQFVFWEKILLSDFNEIDTHRVDAHQLFTNIADLKEIDLLLDDKTMRARHLAFWRMLYPLYENLRSGLSDEGLAYEGMLQRAVVDWLEKEPSALADKPLTVFVGFNALTPVEKALFLAFKKAGKGDFYWDYSSSFLSDPDNNASLFAKGNLDAFPSALELQQPDSENLPAALSSVIHIETTSDVDQTLAVSSVLNELYPDAAAVQTADLTQTVVVLPDERMLIAQMHALPEQITSVNVTMGYPLSQSQLSSLVDEVFALHSYSKTENGSCWFYHKNIINLLQHPVMRLLTTAECRSLVGDIFQKNMTYVPREVLLKKAPMLEQLFTPVADATSMLHLLSDLLVRLMGVGDVLTQEYACRFLAVVNRLTDLWQQHSKVTSALTVRTLAMLMRQMTAMLTVAFEGEPLGGLQVMGVLETRALDFDNLIITSVSDEVFPQKNRRQSMITEKLRAAYSLPTAERSEAVTAYNFYRMLSHAKRVWLISNVSASDNRSGEVSRYLLQLQYMYHLNIEKRKYPSCVCGKNVGVVSISKTPFVLDRLNEYLSADGSRGLSPSALTTYLECPVKFCMSYLFNYRQSPVVSEMAGSDVFGTVFHAVMEKLYEPFVGREVTVAALSELIDNKESLKKTIREVYLSEMYHSGSSSSHGGSSSDSHSDSFSSNSSMRSLDGVDVLTLSVILEYTRRMLSFDKKQTPFTYKGSELKRRKIITISDGEKEKNIRIEGKIDRVDQRNGVSRVIDYKTGSGSTQYDSLSALFSVGCKNPYAVQTLFYCLLLDGEYDNLVPHIYFLRDISPLHTKQTVAVETAVHPKDGTLHYSAERDEIKKLLSKVVSEMLNPDQPFVQNPTSDCRYCHLLSLCPNAQSNLPKA